MYATYDLDISEHKSQNIPILHQSVQSISMHKSTIHMGSFDHLVADHLLQLILWESHGNTTASWERSCWRCEYDRYTFTKRYCAWIQVSNVSVFVYLPSMIAFKHQTLNSVDKTRTHDISSPKENAAAEAMQTLKAAVRNILLLVVVWQLNLGHAMRHVLVASGWSS